MHQQHVTALCRLLEHSNDAVLATDQHQNIMFINEMARHLFGGELRYIGYGGSGKQVRDLLHIDDLLALVLHELAHLDDLDGQTFNVGGGRAVSASLLEMTTLCQECTGNIRDVEAEEEQRAADIPLYISDHRRVTEATGWRPERDVHTIFDDICRWLTDNETQLRSVLS